MLTKCVRTLVFILSVLSLLSCIYVKAQVHSACLVCTWFEALVFWHFCVLRVKLEFTKPGRCHFKEKWLEKDEYKSWLWKDDKNLNKVFCFACKKRIYLNVMEE